MSLIGWKTWESWRKSLIAMGHLLPVPKADSGLRLCGDYKATPIPMLEVDQYPLPQLNELCVTLEGLEETQKN